MLYSYSYSCECKFTYLPSPAECTIVSLIVRHALQVPDRTAVLQYSSPGSAAAPLPDRVSGMAEKKKKGAAKDSGGDQSELKREQKLQAILLADSFSKTFRPITWENPKVGFHLAAVCHLPACLPACRCCPPTPVHPSIRPCLFIMFQCDPCAHFYYLTSIVLPPLTPDPLPGAAATGKRTYAGVHYRVPCSERRRGAVRLLCVARR